MTQLTSEMWDKIFSEVIDVIEHNHGLGTFAKHRSKFEGWFKVELINRLIINGFNAVPERDRIDVTVGNEWAIELKTTNTNYICDGVDSKTRPITKNIKGINKDIQDLKNNKKYANKAVIFIVFPFEKIKKWSIHQKRIQDNLNIGLRKYEFKFYGNEVKGCLFYGFISKEE
jgi:hypothetical protein